MRKNGKKKGPGRPPITDTIPAEKIARAYERTGSARKAAALVGITHRTAIKVLRSLGYKINPPRTWSYTEHSRPRKHSAFAEWLRENQGIELPRSLKALSEMSGVSYTAVNSYMYRRRQVVKNKLNDLPDLIDLGVILECSNLVDEKGRPRKFNSRSFTKYSYHVDHYDLSIYVKADTRDYHALKFPIPFLPDFSREVNRVQKAMLGLPGQKSKQPKQAKGSPHQHTEPPS